MAPLWRIASPAVSAVFVAVSVIGCSPPGAVNEKAVLDSTPHSEPADYAKSPEAYNKHMIERYTGKAKSIPSGKTSRRR